MITQKALVSGTHYSEQNALLGSLPSPTGWELAFSDLLGLETMDFPPHPTFGYLFGISCNLTSVSMHA